MASWCKGNLDLITSLCADTAPSTHHHSDLWLQLMTSDLGPWVCVNDLWPWLVLAPFSKRNLYTPTRNKDVSEEEGWKELCDWLGSVETLPGSCVRPGNPGARIRVENMAPCGLPAHLPVSECHSQLLFVRARWVLAGPGSGSQDGLRISFL